MSKYSEQYRVDARLDELIEFLWTVRSGFIEVPGEVGETFFDYPDYAGMPKHIVLGLSTDTVDKIQEFLPQVAKFSRKTLFESVLGAVLAEDYIIRRSRIA